MPDIKEISPMKGEYYPFIERAVEQLRSYNLKVEYYNINVDSVDGKVVVVFVHADKADGLRGSGDYPDFSVFFDEHGDVAKSAVAR